MIKIQNLQPEQTTLEKLSEFQSEIDCLPDFSEKVEKAKKLFPQKNKKGNSTFNDVKKTLTLMCSGARRCMYCEDSVGDEVEHIKPKTLYPEKCFDWNNYLYACGTCNGPKNNNYAIFDTNGGFVNISPAKGQTPTQPPAGTDVLINPRIDNPLDYCILDLKNTFKFVVVATDFKEKKRAEYTFNEVLRLNEREYLRKARQNAYENFKSRLHRYCDRKAKTAAQDELIKIIDGIKTEAHPTVWKEMQRYKNNGWLSSVDTELDAMFDECPEALSW